MRSRLRWREKEAVRLSRVTGGKLYAELMGEVAGEKMSLDSSGGFGCARYLWRKRRLIFDWES